MRVFENRFFLNALVFAALGTAGFVADSAASSLVAGIAWPMVFLNALAAWDGK